MLKGVNGCKRFILAYNLLVIINIIGIMGGNNRYSEIKSNRKEKLGGSGRNLLFPEVKLKEIVGPLSDNWVAVFFRGNEGGDKMAGLSAFYNVAGSVFLLL